MYRYKRGIKVGYVRQGYIYFVSLMFDQLDERRKNKILKLCAECGGQYAEALFEFVTTETNSSDIERKHFVSKSTLNRCVRKYYERFPKML